MLEKKWTRIEIGYESWQKEVCDEATTMQELLLGYFKKKTVLRWALGGKTKVDVPDVEEKWVPAVLQRELDQALVERRPKALRTKAQANEPRIVVDRLVQLFPELRAAPATKRHALGTTGEPGTRCKLLGDRWINSRSYALLQVNQGASSPWPDTEDPPTELAFITLHWHCLPSDGHPPL